MGGEAGRTPSGGLRSCACSRTGWGRHHHHHEIDVADYTILSDYEATWQQTNGRSSSSVISWPPMTSHYYQTVQSPPHLPAIICPSSSPSTPNCPRLTGHGEPTSTSRMRTGHAMLKPATNTLLKLAKQEP